MGSLGGCDQLADAIKNRPTRRRLRTGSAQVDADIDTYRQGVSLMKGLDSSNPGDQRGWANQAAIHGVPAHFNFCEHGTDHFFGTGPTAEFLNGLFRNSQATQSLACPTGTEPKP